SGAPLWRLLGAGGVRSAFVTVPFTYPAEAFDGVVVSGYGGPERPEILPETAARVIEERVPGLVTAHHPMKERWWEDFGRYAATLIAHVDQIGEACRTCFELEPDLGVLAVDFMSTDFAGHLGYARLDPAHPAHDPAASGDELVQVYQAVDRVCGELIDAAREHYGEEPTAIIMSDHGMKPIYWTFHANEWLRRAGHLRYRRRSLQRYLRSGLRKVALADGRLARTTTWYGRLLDLVPFLPRPPEDRAFADVDFGRTRAYCFATGGQIYLGEATAARDDAAFADRLARDFEAIPHPETGEPLFEVLRKRDIYHGPHLDRAPELVLIPRDERVHVESSRRDWPDVFVRHDTLDPEHFYGYSGHHGVTGIIAAAGPGIRPGTVPEGSEITQLAATVLRLHGLSSDGLEPPIEAMLAPADEAVSVAAESSDGDADVYSSEEEAGILERLRDLGYE
ncbi:MAG: alkaline phosphatase family protein, partial [Gaiellales bacterium]